MLTHLIERLTDLQIRRPWIPIIAVAVVTVFLGFFGARLELRTRYDALLPDNQPSVVELHRVEARTASAQTAMILLEGPDRAALRAMSSALVPQLTALGPEIVSSAENGTQQARAFLMPRAALFLDKKELQQLRDDIAARWNYEVGKATDQLIDDSGPPVTFEQIQKRFEKKADASGVDTGSEGFYERKDGTAAVVIVRSPIPGGDLEKTGPALQRIKGVIANVQASRPEFGAIRVGYAGDMPTGFIEYDSIRKDLLNVGGLGVFLVLAIVLLYFMDFRALFVMGLTIGIALVWTFGITEIAIGHLNVATGFLVTIIAGNGINVGILYQSRYYEERRRGVDVPGSLRTSVRATWMPTLIAAAAAGASYASLFVTDFRAFRQFGFIAAVGMLLCWFVKTMMVPSLLVLLERRRPMVETEGKGILAAIRRFSMFYGEAFAWVVPKAPRLLLVTSVLALAVGSFAAVRYIVRDPMEYNLRATENDPQHNEALHHAWEGVFSVLGASHEGMVVLADTPDEAHQLQKKLQADWDRAPVNAKPFVAVHSLWDLVPDDQEAKLPLLREITSYFEKAQSRGLLDSGEAAKLRAYVPPRDLQAYGLADLPESLVRAYTEKDGTRGRLVGIESDPTNSSDLRYLLRYSDSFRETRLPSGKIVRGSGRAVIFSDVLKAVVNDVPKAVTVSLALTVIAVVLMFRGAGRHTLSVLFALFLGVAGEVLFLYFADVKLNFLNFVALPITFGIGVDYAVNLVQRYRLDGSRDILHALRTTGGAVALCSFTTILGYLALLGSRNGAIRSMGVIAVVGEITCLLAAVTFLPALWYLVERRRERLSK